jgi:glucose/arabinose dehydrogenase
MNFFVLIQRCAAGIAALFLSLAHAQVQLTLVTNAAKVPLDLVSARDGKTMLLVEQAGRIMRLENGAYDNTPFLDLSALVLSGGERGLLGIALHPQYLTNGLFYVNYTRAGDGATVIARFTRNASDPKRADVSSQKILLTINQPYANHNGGALRFGPDGFLYIGMGDGGSGNDPQNYSQNMQSLLGKMLRIDVDKGEPYSVPIDNPFASPTGPSPPVGRPEIFAAGLRNPWRFSFDRLNGDLYIGDVGQDQREEIDLLGSVTTLQFPRALVNFGWRTLEGTRCTGLDGTPACAAGNFTPPILEYGRTEGTSVTGGYRYTGRTVAELLGGHFYVFGDYVSGRIWRGVRAADGSWSKTELIKAPGNIASFAEDDAGELYVLDGRSSIYKITSSTPLPPTNAATQSAKEYFNTSLGHYFITADAAEQRSVETGGAGPGWTATGQTFTVYGDTSTLLPAPGVLLRRVCRFYGKPGVGPNSHFYTSDSGECEFVKARDPGWQYEGLVFTVAQKTPNETCVNGFVPVYRSYNNGFARNDSNHRYTSDLAIHQGMIARGWSNEGIVFCAIAP